MYCKKCGTKLDDDLQFCTECGTEVTKAAATTTQDVSTAEQAGAKGAAFNENNAQPLEKEPVATEGKSASNQKKKRVILIAGIGVLIVALVAAIGFMLWSQEQDRLSAERLAEVEVAYNEFKQQEEAIVINTGEGADKTVLLQQYAALDNLLASLESSVENGDLVLYDGSAYDLSEIEDSIAFKKSSIADWLLSLYNVQLASNSFAETDTASNLSSKACQARLDALAALKAEIENDLGIIGDSNDGIQEILFAIDAQTEQGNGILSQIQEQEEAKANGFIGGWVFDMGNGMSSPSLGGLKFYADGRFYDKEELLKLGISPGSPGWSYVTGTWERVGGIKDGIVTIATSHGTTFYYNINTDKVTCSDGRAFTH